jgi:predicted nucleic acid-binding protein
MKKHEFSRMERDVLIGNEPKIPVILILKIMPDEVYDHRMRNSNKIAGRMDSVPAKNSSSFHCIT